MPLFSPLTLRGAAGLRASLASLLLQALAGDANAFLLVRIRRTQRTNVRSYLAKLALVRAADHDVRLLVHRDLNASRNLELDGMRLAERESNGFALEFRAVANAHEVEILLEALRDAVNRIRDESACEPMQRAMVFRGAFGEQHAVFLFEGDAVGHT